VEALGRANLTHATHTIRAKRAGAVAELADWEQLRQAAKAIKDHTLAHLDTYLLRLEANVTRAGGHVHWAADADEANAIVAGLVRAAGADSVVKVKSMATQETGLNEALAADGIGALETDLAELIVQLGHDRPSHILVPAIHKNRAEIREIFLRQMPDAPAGLTDDPPALAAAARAHLRQAFLSASVGVSGANFAIAETGSLVVVGIGGQRPDVRDTAAHVERKLADVVGLGPVRHPMRNQGHRADPRRGRARPAQPARAADRAPIGRNGRPGRSLPGRSLRANAGRKFLEALLS
jgi:L-lactate dehydrogenase complex protein LldF